MDDDISMQDHLFISYASEDYSVAEWLTLKLTTEGYKVWCDQVKLLGGESYPKDIDKALKERTYRVLALISKHSLNKENPTKERTLALNIGKKRQIEFLIPLNLDETSPSELNWMISDITFIPFHEMAEGFSRLLKKLNSIETPKFEDGKSKICDWFIARDNAVAKQETLWTNLIPVKEMPSAVSQYSCDMKDIEKNKIDWCYWKQNDETCWAFAPPPNGNEFKRLITIAWDSYETYGGIKLTNLFKILCNVLLTRHCVRNGMQLFGKDLFFPKGFFKDDKLKYVNNKNKQTYIKAVGERTFYSMGQKEINRYHLMPVLKFIPYLYGTAVIQLNIRLFITDLSENPIPPTKMNSRRKRLCKDWWNYKWFSRVYAVAWWVRNQDCKLSLLKSENGNFTLGDNLLALSSDFGINEKLSPIGEKIDEDDSGPIYEEDDVKFKEENSDDYIF